MSISLFFSWFFSENLTFSFGVDILLVGTEEASAFWAYNSGVLTPSDTCVTVPFLFIYALTTNNFLYLF